MLQQQLLPCQYLRFHFVPSIRFHTRIQAYSDYRRLPIHSSSATALIEQDDRIHKRELVSLQPTNTTLTRRHTPKIHRGQLSLRSEPWINPESLSDSLEAHRQANRDGHARDGVPVGAMRRFHLRQREAFMRALTAETEKRRDQEDKPREESRHVGVCPPLLAEWRPTNLNLDRLSFPWVSRIERQGHKDNAEAATQRLKSEIRACEQYFSPCSLEAHAASKVFAEIKQIIQEICGTEMVVDLIGSRATGTDSPISDLDINIKVTKDEKFTDESIAIKRQLTQLHKRLMRAKYKESILIHAFLRHARVPIIIGTHLKSGIEFQIQSTVDTYDSLEVTKAYVAEYPTANILFKTIKQLLLMRGMTSGVLGGITSYPLLNMVVTSLKMSIPHAGRDDAGSQLLHFLDFWSAFNFDECSIVQTSPSYGTAASANTTRTIDPITTIPKVVPKDFGARKGNYLMSLQDPANPWNDLGKSAYSIKHIQACFREARESIVESMQKWDDNLAREGGKKEQKPLLAWCLGGDYTSFEEARLQLRRYGEQDPDSEARR